MISFFVYFASVSGIQFTLYFPVLTSSIKVWYYYQLSLDFVPIYMLTYSVSSSKTLYYVKYFLNYHLWTVNEGPKHIVSLKVLAEGAVSEVMGWLDQWLNSTFSNAHQFTSFTLSSSILTFLFGWKKPYEANLKWHLWNVKVIWRFSLSNWECETCETFYSSQIQIIRFLQ